MALDNIPVIVLFEQESLQERTAGSVGTTKAMSRLWIRNPWAWASYVAMTIPYGPGMLMSIFAVSDVKRKIIKFRKTPDEQKVRRYSAGTVAAYTMIVTAQLVQDKLDMEDDPRARAQIILSVLNNVQHQIFKFRKIEYQIYSATHAEKRGAGYDPYIKDIEEQKMIMRKIIQNPNYKAFFDYSRSPILNLIKKILGRKDREKQMAARYAH